MYRIIAGSVFNIYSAHLDVFIGIPNLFCEPSSIIYQVNHDFALPQTYQTPPYLCKLSSICYPEV